VHVEVERGRLELLRVGALRRLAPRLRMREEELEAVRAERLGLGEGVLGRDVGADRLQKIGDSV
jgi:hypothetical protein